MRPTAIAFLAAALGCTSGNSTSSAAISCQSTVIALCKAACACGAMDAGGACALANPVDGSGGGGLRWANASACELSYASVCAEGGAPSFDAVACSNFLPLASCVTSVNVGRALALPATCNVGPADAAADAR